MRSAILGNDLKTPRLVDSSVWREQTEKRKRSVSVFHFKSSVCSIGSSSKFKSTDCLAFSWRGILTVVKCCLSQYIVRHTRGRRSSENHDEYLIHIRWGFQFQIPPQESQGKLIFFNELNLMERGSFFQSASASFFVCSTCSSITRAGLSHSLRREGELWRHCWLTQIGAKGHTHYQQRFVFFFVYLRFYAFVTQICPIDGVFR